MGGDKTRGSAQEVQNQIKELSERENTENEKNQINIYQNLCLLFIHFIIKFES